MATKETETWVWLKMFRNNDSWPGFWRLTTRRSIADAAHWLGAEVHYCTYQDAFDSCINREPVTTEAEVARLAKRVGLTPR